MLVFRTVDLGSDTGGYGKKQSCQARQILIAGGRERNHGTARCRVGVRKLAESSARQFIWMVRRVMDGWIGVGIQLSDRVAMSGHHRIDRVQYFHVHIQQG